MGATVPSWADPRCWQAQALIPSAVIHGDGLGWSLLSRDNRSPHTFWLFCSGSNRLGTGVQSCPSNPCSQTLQGRASPEVPSIGCSAVVPFPQRGCRLAAVMVPTTSQGASILSPFWKAQAVPPRVLEQSQRRLLASAARPWASHLLLCKVTTVMEPPRSPRDHLSREFNSLPVAHRSSPNGGSCQSYEKSDDKLFSVPGIKNVLLFPTMSHDIEEA